MSDDNAAAMRKRRRDLNALAQRMALIDLSRQHTKDYKNLYAMHKRKLYLAAKLPIHLIHPTDGRRGEE